MLQALLAMECDIHRINTRMSAAMHEAAKAGHRQVRPGAACAADARSSQHTLNCALQLVLL